jgi:magnesium chelatase subunit D
MPEGTAPAQAASGPVAGRVAAALTCVAIDPQLGGVLFVGLPATLLWDLARWLHAALTGDPQGGEIIMLGSTQSDDDLWGQAVSSSTDGEMRFGPVAGSLVDPPDGPPRTVIVPDLGRASLAVVRSAVVLIGSPAAVADRHGWHQSWRPRSRWLAACALPDLGRLSPHLLDRFMVRIDATGLARQPLDPQTIRAALDSPAEGGPQLVSLPSPTMPRPLAPGAGLPRLTSSAASLAVETVGNIAAPARRDLALARVARALAWTAGSDDVLDAHVQEAAALLQLTPPGPEPASPPPQPPPEAPAPAGEAAADGPDETTDNRGSPAPNADVPVPSYLEDLSMPAGLLTTLYAEDDPDSMPEYASLREPWQRRSQLRASRGPVIGTEPTRELTDIALSATVVEAAKFQPIRRSGGRNTRNTQRRGGRNAQPGMLIWGSDLRRYRRRSQADTAVVLVLDHTCRRGWDWSTALQPYLRWAYSQRAAITVVEFGHRHCAYELRAEAYRSGSVLDERLAASLERPAGRATPLAHALDVAVQQLRRQLRYGAAATERAWLVVASDGRGNVPLEASQRDVPPEFVSREGIADALAAAAAVRSLAAVRPVVLSPPALTHYRELPFDLADAMGGIVAREEP